VRGCVKHEVAAAVKCRNCVRQLAGVVPGSLQQQPARGGTADKRHMHATVDNTT
jgi:hypothetical protein